MQPTVPCNDKLVGGIDNVTTEVVNFIAKTLRSNDPKIRLVLGITREFIPVEYTKTGPENFIVEAKPLAGGPTEFFEYSKDDKGPKLIPLKPNKDSQPEADSGLSAIYEVSFDLLQGYEVIPGYKAKKVKKKSPPTPLRENNPCPVAMDKLFWPEFDVSKKK